MLWFGLNNDLGFVCGKKMVRIQTGIELKNGVRVITSAASAI